MRTKVSRLTQSSSDVVRTSILITAWAWNRTVEPTGSRSYEQYPAARAGPGTSTPGSNQVPRVTVRSLFPANFKLKSESRFWTLTAAQAIPPPTARLSDTDRVKSLPSPLSSCLSLPRLLLVSRWCCVSALHWQTHWQWQSPSWSDSQSSLPPQADSDHPPRRTAQARSGLTGSHGLCSLRFQVIRVPLSSASVAHEVFTFFFMKLVYIISLSPRRRVGVSECSRLWLLLQA